MDGEKIVKTFPFAPSFSERGKVFFFKLDRYSKNAKAVKDGDEWEFEVAKAVKNPHKKTKDGREIFTVFLKPTRKILETRKRTFHEKDLVFLDEIYCGENFERLEKIPAKLERVSEPNDENIGLVPIYLIGGEDPLKTDFESWLSNIRVKITEYYTAEFSAPARFGVLKTGDRTVIVEPEKYLSVLRKYYETLRESRANAEKRENARKVALVKAWSESKPFPKDWVKRFFENPPKIFWGDELDRLSPFAGYEDGIFEFDGFYFVLNIRNYDEDFVDWEETMANGKFEADPNLLVSLADYCVSPHRVPPFRSIPTKIKKILKWNPREYPTSGYIFQKAYAYASDYGRFSKPFEGNSESERYSEAEAYESAKKVFDETQPEKIIFDNYLFKITFTPHKSIKKDYIVDFEEGIGAKDDTYWSSITYFWGVSIDWTTKINWKITPADEPKELVEATMKSYPIEFTPVIDIFEETKTNGGLK